MPFGSGRQWWPWIHIDDLVRAYALALTDPGMSGSYNVCAPEQPDNRTFLRTLAGIVHRLYLPVGVPGFALKVVMGRQAELLLEGSRCSSDRLKAAGCPIEHDGLEGALRVLLQ